MMIKYQNFVKAMSQKNALILANQTIVKILRFWEKYILIYWIFLNINFIDICNEFCSLKFLQKISLLLHTNTLKIRKFCDRKLT